jgi:hypothetical protein
MWMTEVKCVGNEESILDYPFGDHPGDGTLIVMEYRTWLRLIQLMCRWK